MGKVTHVVHNGPRDRLNLTVFSSWENLNIGSTVLSLINNSVFRELLIVLKVILRPCSHFFYTKSASFFEIRKILSDEICYWSS